MTPPTGDALDIQGMALTIKAAVLAHLQADATFPIPGRVAIAAGSPEQVAWDCEQLLVLLQGIGWGPMEDQAPLAPAMAAVVSARAVRHAVFAVQLVRCTPTGAARGVPPTDAEIDTAGQEMMRDAGMLSQALVEACSQLASGLDRAALVRPGTVDPAGPEGGYHGVVGSIGISVGLLAP